ncbi:MAG: enoyl-CoA hydratase-related protein [Solirubrobacteraceae bacterium]|jgi:enoyl-CoA hydratase / 3-hydroxyacyl-CoA dehydrogenase
MSTAAEVSTERLVERFSLKAFVESCLVLEEGVATVRDIDLAMMTGFGIIPPPFARADATGLDDVLSSLERAQAEWGDAFEPPLILRRLVAQGRLGQKTGQGFFPYPQPDDGFDQGEVVKLQTHDRTAIAWLDNPPANSISPQLFEELARVWEHVDGSPQIRALVIASANPMLYCAGADIKSFTRMDEADGRELLDKGHEILRSLGRSGTLTIAAINGLALGGGCELAMACDVRIAADSAMFGQPEINLGIIPGFGGTQRLPRLVGPAKALEMNATGEAISAQDAYDHGLVNRVVPDHELFDVARSWARKLARQAPLAIERLKRVSDRADLDEGIEAEKEGFAAVFGSQDAREGITAFLEKRSPTWKGE